MSRPTSTSETGTEATKFSTLLLSFRSSWRYSPPMAKPSGPAGRFTGKPVIFASTTVSLVCWSRMSVPRMARSVETGLFSAKASSAGTSWPLTREYATRGGDHGLEVLTVDRVDRVGDDRRSGRAVRVITTRKGFVDQIRTDEVEVLEADLVLAVVEGHLVVVILDDLALQTRHDAVELGVVPEHAGRGLEAVGHHEVTTRATRGRRAGGDSAPCGWPISVSNGLYGAPSAMIMFCVGLTEEFVATGCGARKFWL